MRAERAAAEGVGAWVDPQGYRHFIAAKRRATEDRVESELGAPQGAGR